VPHTERSLDKVGDSTMGLRLSDTTASSNIIPLWANKKSTSDASHEDDSLPEPASLYGLIVLAFLFHTPTERGRFCVRCCTPWPCDHLRLAYRLREAF
jgi:hypothetical protein